MLKWDGEVVEVADGMDAKFRIYLLRLTALLAVSLGGTVVLVTSAGYARFMGAICAAILFFSVGRQYRIGRIGTIIVPAGGLLVALAVARSGGYEALLVLAAGFALLEVIRIVSHTSKRQVVETTWLPFHLGSLGLALILELRLLSDQALHLIDSVIDLTTFDGARVGFWASASPVYLFGILVVLAISAFQPAQKHLTRIALLAGCAIAGKHLLLLFSPVTAFKVSVFQIVTVSLVALLIPSGTVDSEAIKRCWFKIGVTSVVVTIVAAALLQGGQPIKWLAGFASSRSGTERLANGMSANRAARQASPHNVILYSKGLLNWEVPSPSRIGLIRAGMFGLFRKTLDRFVQARSAELIMTDSLAPDILHSADLVVFINPTRELTWPEIATLRSFIEEGGGLLVLGDHTDIGGSRKVLDGILSFSGIRFNFDSAIALRKYWRGCLEIRSHPVTRGITDEVSLQIATGASLAIAQPAEALVIGKYGFSDRGDSLNGGFHAFMGNVTHEREEQLGDVILVAAQVLGRGRILVFGDTSPFQNGSLALTWRLVSNSLEWLTGCSDQAGPSGHQTLCGYGDEIAIIDFSLKPKASLEPFKSNSLGGLANCLARLGIEARMARTKDGWLQEAAFMFFVAPERSLEGEVEYLMKYMERGGHIVLAQGYGGRRASKAILEPLGLAIEPQPLGGGDTNETVVHKEASPISITSKIQTQVLASAFDHPTIVVRRVGLGSFTLIADAKFLLDNNLESERGGNPKNIDFVRRLVEVVRSGDVAKR